MFAVMTVRELAILLSKTLDHFDLCRNVPEEPGSCQSGPDGQPRHGLKLSRPI
jgi:hypothetical protein